MITIAIASRQQTLFSDRELFQKWEVTMKTSNTKVRKFSLKIGKIMMALVFVSMIGGTFITPALARDNRRQGYNDRYRYEYNRRMRNQPRYYPRPVYMPPPVIYDPYPYQSPGISIIFPIHIR
jgi:hypothetical protein